MERIKEALEKARLERQRTGAAAGRSITPDTNRMDRAVDKITYTQTQTVRVSKEHLREKRIIEGDAPEVYTDAYRLLRTQVLQRMNENQWNVLAITSPGPGAGKTLTAVNLAISLAMELEYTVLLVDADLRKPGVHSCFGLAPEYGLSDYLTSDIPISDLLIHPDVVERFVILPGGSAIANSSEMLSSPKMKQLVKELKNRYRERIIIFDVPPLLATSDALAFSPYVDATLLVLEEGKTTAEDARYAIEMLQGANVLGAVLNKSDTSLKGYYSDSEKRPKKNETRLNNLLHSIVSRFRKN